METSTIIFIFLGLYSVLLTTYTVIKARKEKRRKLIVHITKAIRVERGVQHHDAIIIQITNPGDRAVTIDAPLIKLPDGNLMMLPESAEIDVTFPHRLEEGTYCVIKMRIIDIIRIAIDAGYSGVIMITAQVIDAIGKTYRSKKSLELDLNKEKELFQNCQY